MKIHILDLINTDKSAKELLDCRVEQINATKRYKNDIYCGSGEYVDRLRKKGHTVYVVDTPRGLSPLALISSTWKTFQLFRKHKFHIIHLHGSVIGVIGRVAAFLARTPVVVYQVHGFHHHNATGFLKKWIFIQIEKCMSLLTDIILFQNHADMDNCLRAKIAPKKKLVLIGNGVQISDFEIKVDFCNEKKVILCVARFEPIKNHLMLLRAAHILKEREVPFLLQLVGDGDLMGHYKNWVSEHDIVDVVQFLGYRDDVPTLTTQADLCVLPSIKEGLPRAIIEAAAAGKPMVATDVVGNCESIVDGKTGFLVPLNDANIMADKIEQLIDDQKLSLQMGRQAKRYAEENFNERVVTNRIIEVYDKAIQGHKGMIS